MDLPSLERQFSLLHALVDKLFEQHDGFTMNSNWFHLKLSLLISASTQMKNSLLKHLEFEARELIPEHAQWTQ